MSNDIFVFNPGYKTWSKINTFGIQPKRPQSLCFGYQKKLYVFARYFNDFHCFDLETSSWEELMKTKNENNFYRFLNLHGQSTTMIPSKCQVYIIGGKNEKYCL